MSTPLQLEPTDRQKLEGIEKALLAFINEQKNQNLRQNNFMIAQRKINITVLEKIGDVNRGLYGDTKNKVIGALDTQIAHGKDISSLKRSRTRIYAYVFAFAAGVNAAIFFIKELWQGK